MQKLHRNQGRRRGVDWGGHVRPTFSRGCSWDWCKSGEFLLGEGRGSVRFGAWLASRFRTLISMTMLHVTMLQVTIILNCTFSFWQMYHKYLGFREFAKYEEWGKFAAFVGHPKAKRFSASGGDAIAPLNRALTLRMPIGSPFTKTSSGHSAWAQFRYNLCSELPAVIRLQNMWRSEIKNYEQQFMGQCVLKGSQYDIMAVVGPAISLVYRRGILHPVLFANTGTAWTLHMIFNKINKYSIS